MVRYKTIAGPTDITVKANSDYTSAVKEYADIINRETAGGWKLNSIQPISVIGEPGCLGSLVGQRAVAATFNMLIFVRDVSELKEDVIVRQAKQNKTQIEQLLEQGFVAVQGGTFTMGGTEGNEKPAHNVTLSDFQIGKYEVTQVLWKAVMGENPSNFKGDNLPVEQVSWNDVQEFIQNLNETTGKKYRLPTEAEWEYAARGGNKSKGYRYSGGNDVDEVAWYGNNSGSKTHHVGTKQANELGIYDMTGNVWEWVSDWYGKYSSDAQTNPAGPASGSFRVGRGGSWSRDAQYCRVSSRYNNRPDHRLINLGFRLVLSS